MESPISFSVAWTIGKDLIKWVYRHLRKPTPEERLRKRKKWKGPIDEHILDQRVNKLRCEAIMRDIRRMDTYPNIDERKNGILPWFKVGLLITRDDALLCGLGWQGLKRGHNSGEWRKVDYRSREREDLRAILVGYLPFHLIEYIEWSGDEYYGFPTIFCHFEGKVRKSPFDKLIYCAQTQNPNAYPS